MPRKGRNTSSHFKLRNPEQLINNMKDLVKCNFVVQRSVAYLDLSICEFSNFRKKGLKKIMLTKSFSDRIANKSEQLSIERKVFNTEESCKKYWAPNRKLLYHFHLDVSKELELSLRNLGHQEIKKCYSEKVLLNKIVCETDMYETCLLRLITEALQVTNKKIELIIQLSKIAKRMKFLANDTYLIEKGLIFLCFQRADTIVVNDFLTAMNLDDDYLFTLPLDVFEFVLYHANQSGYKLWPHHSCKDPISASICYEMFVRTESLFQYFHAPRICDHMFIRRVNWRWLLTEDELKALVENKLITRARYYLISLILLVFMNRQGLKALQMLWRSILNPFITFQEFTLIMPRTPPLKFTELTCSFVPIVTGENCLEGNGLQPRKLKHHCRTVIRRVLSNNRHLATGVDQLKLPTSFKSYLTLEN